MATIFDRVNAANDRAARLEMRFGHPQRNPLLARLETLDLTTGLPQIADTLIDPWPCITTPSPRLIGLVVGNDETGLTISANDVIAEVNRSIPYRTFVRCDDTRPLFMIDPPLNADGTVAYGEDGVSVDGRWSFVVHVDDRDCCVWKVILRRERDR